MASTSKTFLEIWIYSLSAEQNKFLPLTSNIKSLSPSSPHSLFVCDLALPRYLSPGLAGGSGTPGQEVAGSGSQWKASPPCITDGRRCTLRSIAKGVLVLHLGKVHDVLVPLSYHLHSKKLNAKPQAISVKKLHIKRLFLLDQYSRSISYILRVSRHAISCLRILLQSHTKK